MSGSRCGFVAVVGRPNVGKSTLINALMGSKVSIVTAKPQTTRHRILAVRTTGDTQVIFIDTPGLHRKADKAMNRMMNRTAASALADADLVLFVIEAERWTEEDGDVLRRLASVKAPVVAVLNKVDLVRPKEKLLAIIGKLSERREFAGIVPLSASKKDNLEALADLIPDYLPESPHLFPSEMRTDRGIEFHAAEIIREKLTLSLHQEVPYGLTVQIEQIDEGESQTTINAVIWVERDGREARLELKQQLGRPVHLELWVKVKDNWADSEKDLLRLGYESP